MAKIDSTKTELVWPGQYNEDGAVKEKPCLNLPFQVIETINESRATRKLRHVFSLLRDEEKIRPISKGSRTK